MDQISELEQEEIEELAEDEELRHLPRKGRPETLGSISDQRFPVAEPKEKIDLMKSPSLPSEVRDAWEAKIKAMEKCRDGASLLLPVPLKRSNTPLRRSRDRHNSIFHRKRRTR